MNMETLTAFFAWMSFVNICLLFISTLTVMTIRKTISAMHAKMFALDESELPKIYFQYIAQYKIAVIVLNITPYIALKLMA